LFWFLGKLWSYRSEVILAVQLLVKLRKSAQAFAREYIRRKIRTKLRGSVIAVGMQVLAFCILYWLNVDFPSLGNRLLASTFLWLMTLYNLLELTLVTLPELRELYRALRGKTGYALKYFLQVSVVTELLRLNVLFLVICFAVGVSSRTALGMRFSYTKPWKVVFSQAWISPPISPKTRNRVDGLR
jgi:hypothetical protein